MTQQFHFKAYTQEKVYSQKTMYTNTHSSTVPNSQKVKTHISINLWTNKIYFSVIMYITMYNIQL